MDIELTEKQITNRKYYLANRPAILAQKEKRRREAGALPREIMKSLPKKMYCYICKVGEIVTDGEIWSCLNPACEADFREVE